MEDTFQYRDLPQIPTLTDEHHFTFWGQDQFDLLHTSQGLAGRATSFQTEYMDYGNFSGHSPLNMQPMQRFLHGMDPSPFAPGLLHANLDRSMSLKFQHSSQYERPWPSADCLPYSSRNGSPDRTSISGTSSHNPQNELCSPHAAHSAPYASPIEFSQARVTYPSPEHFNDRARPSELPLPGDSINLRAIELHHEEPEVTMEERDHVDTKSDGEYEYEQEPIYTKTEPATDHYKGYPESGMGNAVRDAESVQPMTQSDESDSDYKPSSARSPKKRRSSTSSRSSGRQNQKRGGRKGSTASSQPNSNRVTKRARGSNAPVTVLKSPNASNANDAHDMRPFPCPLAGYGCTSNFVSKNEWKRHVNTQHIKLGFWRCDLCATTVDPHDDRTVYHNDFNRKDLFTQHLRRMHAAPNNSSARSQREWPVNEDNIIDHQKRCYKTLRGHPQQSTCLFCERMFAGPTSWEERMEHVGRHLEKDRKIISLDLKDWNEDKELEQWLLHEGLIARDLKTGEWKIGDGKPMRHRTLDNDTDSGDDA